MDVTFPAEDDPRRTAVRDWLENHPDPSPTDLADAGYVAPSWPPPWGLGAAPEDELIIFQELDRAGVDPAGHNPIGIGWAGPTILAAGTEPQKQRFLTPLLRGEEFWSQLFSEPGAGSDLASISTRAVRDDEYYIVNGQKVWNTWAGVADYGILLARTDPTTSAHRGISYFLMPMRQPGVTVRPIREMTGRAHFNEVFLEDALVPVENLLGTEGDGWRLAKLTLANERVSLSEGGVLWGMGPTTYEVIAAAGPGHTRSLRDRAARLYIEAEVMRLMGYRVATARLNATAPGPEVAAKKLLADRHGQRVMEWARDMGGARGLLIEDEEESWGYLFARALTIGGGTSEVLKGIIGEQILGLPREPQGDSR